MLMFGVPLPQAAVDLLVAHGFIEAAPVPTIAPGAGLGEPGASALPIIRLSRSRNQIREGLMSPTLSRYQVIILLIYVLAKLANEGKIPVSEAGNRLVALTGIDAAYAANLVRGSIRSFGRRLSPVLGADAPKRIGFDRNGDDVLDVVPSLALFHVQDNAQRERCHVLTDDGLAGTMAALAAIYPDLLNLIEAHRGTPMTDAGQAAAIAAALIDILGEGDGNEAAPAIEPPFDPDAPVTVDMTALAAALIGRVQQSHGFATADETIKYMTAQAGAG